MGLFDGFNPFKGPGRSGLDILGDLLDTKPTGSSVFSSSNKRSEARELIKSAQEYVDLGKRAYESGKESAERAQRNAEKAVRRYQTFCRDTSRKLGESINPVLTAFDRFHIDGKIAPQGSSPIKTISPNMSFSVSSSFAPTHQFSILDLILDEYQYEKAKEQRDRAKRYYEEMKMVREEFRAHRDNLDQISSYINQEISQMETLTGKVISITEKLKGAMQHNSFTETEAEYLKSIRVIADNICAHLSTEFLSPSGAISQKYKEQSDALKALSDGISSAPAMDDQAMLNLIRAASKLPVVTY